jgi:hypothetical protein
MQTIFWLGNLKRRDQEEWENNIRMDVREIR